MSIAKALEIAEAAHQGQYRRDGITPYIKHCYDVRQRVKQRLKNVQDTSVYEQVALLHDILEDTKVTATDLTTSGIINDVIDAVKCLTKSSDVTYFDYLKRVKQNMVAKEVKIADMLSNISDDPSDRQIIKYSKGLQYLLS